MASSRRQSVTPSGVSAASVLPSGAKASGAAAPGKNRTSFHPAVSRTRTPSAHATARREPSREIASGPGPRPRRPAPSSRRVPEPQLAAADRDERFAVGQKAQRPGARLQDGDPHLGFHVVDPHLVQPADGQQRAVGGNTPAPPPGSRDRGKRRPPCRGSAPTGSASRSRAGRAARARVAAFPAAPGRARGCRARATAGRGSRRRCRRCAARWRSRVRARARCSLACVASVDSVCSSATARRSTPSARRASLMLLIVPRKTTARRPTPPRGRGGAAR